ncbi:MAG: hypothetical protein AAGM22_20305 [Acidobacteriota bacterium]
MLENTANQSATESAVAQQRNGSFNPKAGEAKEKPIGLEKIQASGVVGSDSSEQATRELNWRASKRTEILEPLETGSGSKRNGKAVLVSEPLPLERISASRSLAEVQRFPNSLAGLELEWRRSGHWLPTFGGQRVSFGSASPVHDKLLTALTYAFLFCVANTALLAWSAMFIGTTQSAQALHKLPVLGIYSTIAVAVVLGFIKTAGRAIAPSTPSTSPLGAVLESFEKLITGAGSKS